MRSPNYPAVSLGAAIDCAMKIWDKDKRTALSPGQACVAMGYKSLSGASRVVLSALKKYGLLDETDDGKLKLSDRAITILHKPPITREYKKAVHDAILGVDLFAKLLETHPGASNDTLRAHLICDHDFTEEGAERFIHSFSETKALDETLGTGHNISESYEKAHQPPPSNQSDPMGWLIGANSRVPAMPTPTPAISGGTRQEVVTIDSSQAILQWPESISEAGYEDLKDWLEMALRKIKRSIKKPGASVVEN